MDWNTLTIVEWFGGIGAATKAIRNFGIKYEVVDYVENNKHSVKAYNALHNTNFEPQDINDIDTWNYPYIDLLIAGWPCQDLSTAGKQAGLAPETRSGLIWTTIRKLQEMRCLPSNILLENVKGLKSPKFKESYDAIKEAFKNMGYVWHEVILNAKHFGVPQNRERVYIWLSRAFIDNFNDLENVRKPQKVLRDILDFSLPTFSISLAKIKEYTNYYIFPRKLDGQLIGGSYNRIWKVEKMVGTIATSNIPKIGYFENQMPNYHKKTIKLNFDKFNNQDPNKINVVGNLGTMIDKEHIKTPYASASRMVGAGGVFPSLTSGHGTAYIGNIIFKKIPFIQDNLFIGIKGQSPTLVSNSPSFKNKVIYDKENLIHYRKLSAQECMLLMGFDKTDYDKLVAAGVSNSQIEKQAGNSIVVNVLEEIFKKVDLC